MGRALRSGYPLEEEVLDESEASDGRPPAPRLVGRRFQILRKLGSGSYSVVRLAFDQTTKQLVAVKFEWQKAEKTDKLLKEAELCETFGTSSPYTPTVLWSGIKGEFNIMAMDLLGPSLEDIFMKKCHRRFSLKSVLMIAEQMIDCMEFVHSHGIIHRDIKPSNFVVGSKGQQDKIYVVDFGLAKRYQDRKGKHIAFAQKSGMTGTARYTTVNLHRGFEPSRRDDLGSIGYVLMYFLVGRLPWQGINHPDRKKRKQKIGQKKMLTPHEKLCKGFPKEFIQYLEYCDSLGFEEKPNYDHLRGLMRRAGARHQLDFDGQFDWVNRKRKSCKLEEETSTEYETEYSSYDSTYESYDEKTPSCDRAKRRR